MESKIRIKLGPIEVEYEGSEAFLKNELPNLIKTVTELYKTREMKLAVSSVSDSDMGKLGRGTELQLTTGSIAAKLACKSGPDLVLAAAAHLTLVQGLESFSRKQVSDEMKKATAYYKASYLANLTPQLQSLIKANKLLEPSTEVYALNAQTRDEMRSLLAN